MRLTARYTTRRGLLTVRVACDRNGGRCATRLHVTSRARTLARRRILLTPGRDQTVRLRIARARYDQTVTVWAVSKQRTIVTRVRVPRHRPR